MGTETVLIIEDDGDTQANLRDILELDGYRIETAASVRETLVERDWSALFTHTRKSRG